MLTAPEYTYALSNLTLICGNGAEAVGRLTKSPYISTTSVTKPLHRQEQAPIEEPTTNNLLLVQPKGRIRKRSRGVRFSPETLDHIEQTDQQSRCLYRSKKRRRFEPADSAVWYSKVELRGIQKSCVRSLKSCLASPNSATNDAIETLARYHPVNQKRRRLARFQMYQTIKAVQQFERSTNTKAPELLASLLQRHSTIRAMEANVKGLQTAEACALSRLL